MPLLAPNLCVICHLSCVGIVFLEHLRMQCLKLEPFNVLIYRLHYLKSTCQVITNCSQSKQMPATLCRTNTIRYCTRKNRIAACNNEFQQTSVVLHAT